MNFYKRHLGDYAKDAGHLSMLEHGAYTLLLDRYYTTEQPIAQADVYRVCRARTKEEREAVDTVLREFFVTDGESYLNRRAEEELAKADHQRTVNREQGKRGGRPKRTDSVSETETEPITESVSEQEPNDNPSQTPDTRHHSGLHKPSGKPTAASLLVVPADGQTDTARAYKVPDCPYSALLTAYQEALPVLAAVSVLNDARKEHMRARWREVCAEDKLDAKAGLEWFRWFFCHVAKSRHLTGRGRPKPDGSVWRANFDWLLLPTNFAKVVDGNYHDARATA